MVCYWAVGTGATSSIDLFLLLIKCDILLSRPSWLIVAFFTLTTGRPGEKGKSSGLESLQREIAILKKVDHPYIVRLYEVGLLSVPSWSFQPLIDFLLFNNLKYRQQSASILLVILNN